MLSHIVQLVLRSTKLARRGTGGIKSYNIEKLGILPFNSSITSILLNCGCGG